MLARRVLQRRNALFNRRMGGKQLPDAAGDAKRLNRLRQFARLHPAQTRQAIGDEPDQDTLDSLD